MAKEAWLNFKSLVDRIEVPLKEAPGTESDARLHRLMIGLNELELCYLAIDLVEPTEDRINARKIPKAGARKSPLGFLSWATTTQSGPVLSTNRKSP